MKKRKCTFIAGLALGLFSLALARRYQRMRARTLAWQKRQNLTLDVLYRVS